MNKFRTLNTAVHIALTPVVTSLEVRAEAAKRYALPLRELHTYSPDIIEATIKQYNEHLHQFLAAVEDNSQSPAIKLPLLRFPIQQGLRFLAAGAFSQINARRPDLITADKSDRLLAKDYLNSHFGIAAKIYNHLDASLGSIMYHVQSKIDFVPLTERLCRIVENNYETLSVRVFSIHALDHLQKQGVQSFGVSIDREPLEERLLMVGLNTKWPALTTAAIHFTDGLNPASRIPSLP